MTAEQYFQIISLLISGGVVTKLIDLVAAGFRDAKRARGGGDCTVHELEAAFWAEETQKLREKALSAGMSAEEIGPIPHFVPPQTSQGG